MAKTPQGKPQSPVPSLHDQQKSLESVTPQDHERLLEQTKNDSPPSNPPDAPVASPFSESSASESSSPSEAQSPASSTDRSSELLSQMVELMGRLVDMSERTALSVEAMQSDLEVVRQVIEGES